MEKLNLSELKKRHEEGTLIGCFEVENNDYHAGPGISKSHLDEINRSGAHYQYWLQNREAPTNALLLGSLIHTIVLEPEKFSRDFRVITRKTLPSKEERAAFTLETGQEQVTEVMVENATYAAGMVLKHPIASKLLAPGCHKELAFYWRDEATGLICKCKADILSNTGLMVDLKSTEDASLGEFKRKIGNYRYHVQAAWYLHGAKQAILQSKNETLKALIPRAFIFLAVETSEPYEVGVYTLDPGAMALGLSGAQASLEKLHQCLTTNTWPGYPHQLIEISLPPWVE